MNVKIDQSDLKALKKKMDNLRVFDKKTLSNELGRAGLDIARTAKKSVVVDTGNLKQSINAELKGKTVEVVARAKYAPYIEFGTGGMVDLTDMRELGIPDSYASQFKGKGIKEVNLPPRPFFFSSARVGLKKLLDRLNNELNKAIK